MAYELTRDGFTLWLKGHESKGTEYIGMACMVCGCPISEYLTSIYKLPFDVLGTYAHVIGVGGTWVTMPIWAREFIRTVDSDHCVIGTQVGPRTCLDILESIPLA